MASIEGLAEHQCAALAGISVGDLVLVQFVPEYDSDSESYDEEGSDDDEGDEDEDEDEDEDDDDEVGSGVGGDEVDMEDDSDSVPENPASDASAEQSDSTAATEVSATEAVEMSVPATAATETAATETAATETTPATRMFVVSEVVKDESGVITDAKLSLLTYSDNVTSHAGHAYHIYGQDCIHYHPASCDQQQSCAVSVQDIAGDSIIFSVNVSGDTVRLLDAGIWTGNQHHSRCVTGCNQGFLNSADRLANMVKDYDAPTLAYAAATGRPLPISLQPTVCPVCIGLDFMKDQQTMQATLLQTHHVDITEVFEFHSRLNPRRRALGYRYRQFDEREWGLRFDDMDSEDEEEEEGGRFEHWEEAQDPNSSPSIRPASAATIASLPRKAYKDATLDVDDCQICREDFKEDTQLIELPCGHEVFDETCLVTWLKQYDNCPMCRKKIPAVAAPGGASVSGGGAAATGAAAANGMEQDGVFEMDEDQVMSDD